MSLSANEWTKFYDKLGKTNLYNLSGYYFTEHHYQHFYLIREQLKQGKSNAINVDLYKSKTDNKIVTSGHVVTIVGIKKSKLNVNQEQLTASDFLAFENACNPTTDNNYCLTNLKYLRIFNKETIWEGIGWGGIDYSDATLDSPFLYKFG